MGAGLVVVHDQLAVHLTHQRTIVVKFAAKLIAVNDARQRLPRKRIRFHQRINLWRDPSVGAERVVDVGGAAAGHGIEDGTPLSDDDIGLRDILLGMKRCVGGHADLNDLDASRGPCFDERPSRVTTQIVAKQKRADRPPARSGTRDQPLGIDRLAQAHNAMGYVECG